MKCTISFNGTEKIICTVQWDFNDKSEYLFSCTGWKNGISDFIHLDQNTYKTHTLQHKEYFKPYLSQLSYTIEPLTSHFIGSSIEDDLNLPFANANEFFMSNGSIMIPYDRSGNPLHEIKINLIIQNNTNFKLVTHFSDSQVTLQELQNFFIFLTKNIENAYIKKSAHLEVSIIQSIEAHQIIPSEKLFNIFDEYNKFYLNELGSSYHNNITLLNIIPDPQFQKIAQNKTFASGSNFRNGIFMCLPNDSDYLKKNFGQPDYLQEIKIGLLHEIGHFYVSPGSDNGKSIISPSMKCSKQAAHFIGEDLNSFFTYELAQKLKILDPLISINKKNVFFEINKILEENSTSLWSVFKNMVNKQRTYPQPFDGIDYLFNEFEPFVSKKDLKKIEIILNNYF